jgi:thiol-disulfide isomerase/thioredoxin
MRTLLVLSFIAVAFVGALFAGVVWMKSDNSPMVFSQVRSPVRASGGEAVYSFRLSRMRERAVGKLSSDPVSETFSFPEMSAGKTTVVNFWASWCEPCQREFPSFQRLAKELGSEVQLLLVSVDDDREAVRRFLKIFEGSGANIEILWDPGSSVAFAFGTQKLPESYIFDRKSRMRRKVAGFEDWSRPEVVQFLRGLSAEP